MQQGFTFTFVSMSKSKCQVKQTGVSFFTAQPNPPKIHEGWWAYKEVVQGNFVPGKPQYCLHHSNTLEQNNAGYLSQVTL